MSILGKWDYYYDWNNTGNYSQTTITFNSDGTFINGQGAGGKWNLLDGSIVINYTGGTIYAGNMCGHAMVGTMNSLGAWYTVHQKVSKTLEKNVVDTADGDKK
jgi:hypothetical protein